jgi:DNA-directed RNA polymerase specialized sigma24 family protein
MSDQQPPRPRPLTGINITEADTALLPSLSAEQRAILEAKGSYQEIAQALGIASVGTVRSRLNRARAALVKLREAHSA